MSRRLLHLARSPRHGDDDPIAVAEAQRKPGSRLQLTAEYPTRRRALKIPEVSNLRVGKRVDTTNNPHTFFFSFDVENMDKLAYIHENAVFVQFEKQILGPFVASSKVFDYEMEPGKDVRYS